MSHSPQSIDELADCLTQLNTAAAPVVPICGDTHSYIGAKPADNSTRLDLSGLAGVRFHEPADMVAAFGAGTTLADVQSHLAATNQRLDIDPGHAGSTLGGAVAIDHCGPRCHGWGSLRDKILGLTYVLPKGDVIKIGGRVMKNVAGYDLSKLMIGSLGTLGVIDEVIFRANPIGDTERGWLFEIADLPTAWKVAAKIQASQLEPLALCVLDQVAAAALTGVEISPPETAPPKTETPETETPETETPETAVPAYIFVAAEGVAAFVDHHESTLTEIVETAPTRTFAGPELCEIWNNWHDRLHCRADSRFVVRFGARGSRCGHLLKDLAEYPGLITYPGRGMGYVNLDDMESVMVLRQKCELFGGYAAIHWSKEPYDAETVWGVPRDDATIMAALKQMHDPNGILNPGRFYGGI